jgi:hypothetical protein
MAKISKRRILLVAILGGLVGIAGQVIVKLFDPNISYSRICINSLIIFLIYGLIALIKEYLNMTNNPHPKNDFKEKIRKFLNLALLF